MADHSSWNLLILTGCVGRGRFVQNRCVIVGSLWAERERERGRERGRGKGTWRGRERRGGEEEGYYGH